MIPITLRKLASLLPRARDRKVLGLLGEFRDRLAAGETLTDDETHFLREAMKLAVPGLAQDSSPPVVPTVRSLLRWQRVLEEGLGVSSADWDLQAPGDRTEAAQGFALTVYLEDLRSAFNVGSILRTAEAFGFASAILSPACPPATHPRVLRTAMGAAESLAVENLSLDELKLRYPHRPVVALELGGTDVQSFMFPQEGILLLGNEELGLSPEALAWADASAGRVTIPLYGRKASVNVGVAFGIAAAAWTSACRPT